MVKNLFFLILTYEYVIRLIRFEYQDVIYIISHKNFKEYQVLIMDLLIILPYKKHLDLIDE